MKTIAQMVDNGCKCVGVGNVKSKAGPTSTKTTRKTRKKHKLEICVGCPCQNPVFALFLYQYPKTLHGLPIPLGMTMPSLLILVNINFFPHL